MSSYVDVCQFTSDNRGTRIQKYNLKIVFKDEATPFTKLLEKNCSI